MKLVISILLSTTIVSTKGGLLYGGHFAPNIVASRTIIGGAVGGPPSSGAFSTAEYSQTVAAPGAIHTIVSTPAHHLHGTSPTHNNIQQNNNHRNTAGYATYTVSYTSGPGTHGHAQAHAQGQTSRQYEHAQSSQHLQTQQQHHPQLQSYDQHHQENHQAEHDYQEPHNH